MSLIEKMSEAYWNASVCVPRWHNETEEQRETVRHRMRAAIEAMANHVNEQLTNGEK